MNQIYNVKKVHRINLFSTYGIIIFYIIAKVITNGSVSMTTIIPAASILGLSTLVYFVPFPNLVKGQAFGFIPTVTIFLLFAVDGYSLDKHYILFVGIAMIAMYFEARMLLIHAIYLDISMVALYMTKPVEFMGENATSSTFVGMLIMINATIIGLFLLNTWSKKLLKATSDKEQEIEKIMESLQETMGHVEETAEILERNMEEMTSSASSTKESSNQISVAMQEIAIGVQEQAGSVTEINHQVNTISHDVNEAQDISTMLTESNNTMMTEMAVGEQEIGVMEKQMLIIDDAIEAAIVTVKDLESSMADIQRFLEVITQIANQTNLLALNASIESARAGEMGKGFAVVADEIRKLAEESSHAVNDINDIVNSIGTKTKDAVATVEQGNVAIDEGNTIIKNLALQYEGIKDSFSTNNAELGREIKMIHQINTAFSIVHERIANIASISEEQSASTEEILATIENQDENIMELNSSLVEIEGLARRLKELLNQ